MGAPRDDGRAFRLLNVLKEFTCECSVIPIRCKLSSLGLVNVLADLFILGGISGEVIHELAWADLAITLHFHRVCELIGSAGR